MSQLQYVVNVNPEPPGADVVSRNLSVFVNGSLQQVVSCGPMDSAFPPVSVPQGANIRFEVTNVDDGGNSSPPATLDFTATDTIPPPQPTGVSFNLVSESGP